MPLTVQEIDEIERRNNAARIHCGPDCDQGECVRARDVVSLIAELRRMRGLVMDATGLLLDDK